MSLVFGPPHIPVVIAVGRPPGKEGEARGGAGSGMEARVLSWEGARGSEVPAWNRWTGRAATGETRESQGGRILRIHTAWILWKVEKTEGTKGTKALPWEEETDGHK